MLDVDPLFGPELATNDLLLNERASEIMVASFVVSKALLQKGDVICPCEFFNSRYFLIRRPPEAYA